MISEPLRSGSPSTWRLSDNQLCAKRSLGLGPSSFVSPSAHPTHVPRDSPTHSVLVCLFFVFLAFGVLFDMLFGRSFVVSFGFGMFVVSVFVRLVSVLVFPVRLAVRLGMSAGSFLLAWSKPKKVNVFGQAQWMDETEMSAFLSLHNTGFVLSERYRLPLAESAKGTAIIAPSGSGKSSSLILPNLFSCSSSFVATDPSLELYEKSSGYLVSQGYLVQLLQPNKPEQSLQFNPLTRSSTKPRLKQLAEALATLKTTDRTENFWVVWTSSLLFLCFVVLRNQARKELNTFANVKWLVSNLGNIKPESPIIRYMLAHLDEQERAVFQTFVGFKENLRGSLIASAMMPLSLWDDEGVRHVTSGDTLNLDALRQRKTALYISIPEDKQDYYSPLLSIFYTVVCEFCLETGQDEKSLPIFFFLDEFGQYKINRFETIATTFRKHKCCICIVLQSISQLEDKYGKAKAATIFQGGMQTKIFLSGGDPQTTEEVSRILGYETVEDKGEGERAPVRNFGKPLLRPDEVRMLGSCQAIAIITNRKPILLHDLTPYYQNSTLTKYSQMKPAPFPVSTGGDAQYVEFRG